MQSLWNDTEAQNYGDDPLALRVYTSRLLGQDPSLVLHGGGNTSVKAKAENFFGEEEYVLYVKGSGWDLATIEAPGFSPVRMSALLKLAEMDGLSDSVIVREQRAALLDPYAPNPSVEAILHALIPFDFVDHTHADAVVAMTNTPDGERYVKQVYGDRVLIVPYVMPGFTLAREVYLITRDLDWDKIDGIILMNHGVFTFANDAKTAYEMMIKLVTEAEDYLQDQGAWSAPVTAIRPLPDLVEISQLRQAVSRQAGKAMITTLVATPEATGFASRDDVKDIATRGPLTPDHVIRTKRIPMIIDHDIADESNQYKQAYQGYFEAHADKSLTMLDPAPRWGVWKDVGTVAFGDSLKATTIIQDITRHTVRAIQWAEALGGWQALPAQDIFDVEYWELEQAKLKKGGTPPVFQGKVGIVTGAASGIGKACVDSLVKRGAVVLALDIDPSIEDLFSTSTVKGIVCDVTDTDALQQVVESAIKMFGGLDIVVSNAGIFPKGVSIEDMDSELWERSMRINLTSHQRLLQLCIPYLKHGIDPAIVIVGTRNIPAPGPTASAYSVPKAGLAQLARIAAMELAEFGIRVNTVNPDAVFDTGIWTEDILEQRAKSYGLTVDAYQRRNLLKTPVASAEVAELICELAGPRFSKTTGAQIPIDGGNMRVI